jgi:hypothetical protein
MSPCLQRMNLDVAPGRAGRHFTTGHSAQQVWANRHSCWSDMKYILRLVSRAFARPHGEKGGIARRMAGDAAPLAPFWDVFRDVKEES